MKVVKFKYCDEFKCLGPECRDTCCKDWSITLTKAEYFDYKKMKCSPELREVLDNTFVRTKNGNEAAYAEVKLCENGECPLHGEDRLCMLQKELGTKALSLTCNVFPRLRAFVGLDVILESLHATCYHVIEILMQHPEGLQIVEEEYDKSDRYINRGQGSAFPIHNKHKEYPYFWNILNAKVDILQNRNFTIPERMLILGYFCQKADEYIKNDTMDKIPGLAAMLLDNELCKKIADSLKPPMSEGEISSNSLNFLVEMRHALNFNTKTEHTKKDFDAVFERLKLKNVIRDGAVEYRYGVPEYIELCKKFRAIENERPYIIENLLVNELFYYNPERGMWGNYFDMAVFYNILKVFASAFLPEDYTDSDLALALCKAVKNLANSGLTKGVAHSDFIQKDRYTLPYAAFLIC